MLIGVGVSCRISYSIVNYLYVSFSGMIISVGKERANLFYRLLVIMWFLFGGVPLPLGAWNRLRYFIVALTGPSI